MRAGLAPPARAITDRLLAQDCSAQDCSAQGQQDLAGRAQASMGPGASIMMLISGHHDACPVRTTLTLDDDLAEQLNKAARRSGRRFKDVVNDTLRRGLAMGAHPPSSDRDPFVVRPQASGFRAGIDPLRLNQLSDQMEMAAFLSHPHNVAEPT